MDSYTLKSVSDLPPPFRSIFSFRYFNSLQSECFPVCYHSDVNMVISAPTGSGKTVLFELCILRLLSRFISEGRFVHVKGILKTIYIAPSKALVQEKLRDWTQKFGSLGINCLELTGDNEFYNTRTIQEADIILTTPEKFDSVTRYRIKDGGLSFFSDIGLLLIDEVHLLNDPRGAALEAIVSRIKMLAHKPEMKSSPLSCVRFLAVSATIPNIEDLAEWLNIPVQGIKRFGEEMRPVKLTTKVFDILMHYSRGKSALVFCSTRKGAQEAALKLSQTAMTFGYSNPFIKDKEQQERLREASLSCSDKQLQSYILYGVGYHNGGLCLKDRSLIEGLFLKGDIKILCTTNTLAHGINLPAHTVVIKSTQHFNKEKGLYMEYDRSMILQVHLYENILSGCEMVESQLLSCVTEHLTAEIVQLTVSDIARAIEWMKCSYLYNPEHYAVKQGISRDRIEKQMQEITVQKVNELSHHQMIWTDKDGFLLKPLEPGRLMTRYYLKFNTMKHVMQTPENCSLEDALNVICHAEEIAWIQLRRNEKKLLNDINIDKDCRIRFHINGDKQKRKKRIQTREEKIFVLANDCLTGDPSVHDLSLTQDMNSICSNGCRIARCMKEYFIFKRNYKGAINSTLLAKSLYQKLWDDSPYLLKQLPGIGMVTAKALHSMGIKSFDTLAEADPRRIEILTGRKFPFGNHIKDSLLSLPPKVSMSIEENECHRRGMSKFVVTLTRLSQPLQSSKRHYADMVRRNPYSAGILLSIPQQKKLTLKANLIFEEYSNRNFDMPSFKLIDEDLELGDEGEPGFEIQNDSCKIISEQTIFEHIREKAKNFPLLTTSSNVCSPPSEAMLLTRKRRRDKAIELDSAPNATEETEGSKISLAFLNVTSEQGERERYGHDSYKLRTPKHHTSPGRFVVDLVDDSGGLPSKSETSGLNGPTQDTIFDHIRKKAQYFPALSRTMQFDPVAGTNPYSFENQPDVCIAASQVLKEVNTDRSTGETIIISDSENRRGIDAYSTEPGSRVKDDIFSRSPHGERGSSSAPPKVSCINTDPSSIETLHFDISMIKHNTRLAGSGNSTAYGRKKQSSPNGSKRHCCSLEMAGKNREVDSFLGFTSVFSFL
ncbi:hypothetical protein POTOM_006273 [Populus tomentosa]|uniref:DNA 3'-5' helicase n=1 Tax=Populus tomentosa TaxID=118781 RepID=A0A8X8AKQ1_POPTO|nr:hypothetical protein POTOM_006273 [Populus tomentosa]